MNNNTLVDIVEREIPTLRVRSGVKPGLPLNPQVAEAMRRIDRRAFVPEIPVTVIPAGPGVHVCYRGKKIYFYPPEEIGNPKTLADLAYFDEAFLIRKGESCTMPSVVALIADLLELQPENKVLEVGSGCSYSTAVTALLVSPGRVYAVEISPEWAETGRINLERLGLTNVEVINADGLCGLPKYAPFDKMYFSVGINSLSPTNLEEHRPQLDPLREQLSSDGILVVPIVNGLMKEVYNGGQLKTREFTAPCVGFVSVQRKAA